MARSGSTLLCKCLGCMKGVVLLSEIHPLGERYFNPLTQAREWYQLITQPEQDELQAQGDFRRSIALIESRCRSRGETLVLRDWAHLDYTGHPFMAPGYQPQLQVKLAPHFDTLRICTTRDPVTQWQSLSRLNIVQTPIETGVFGLEQFLLGYRHYAELCAETGFIRYEDFLRKPELPLRRLCTQLDIRFDPGFITKWASYTRITGDINNTRAGDKIRPTPRQPLDPALRKRFLANADYRRACKLLGYDTLAR